MKKIYLLFILIFISTVGVAQKKTFTLKSPNGIIEAEISVGDTLSYSLKRGNATILYPSPVFMSLNDGKILGIRSKLKKTSERNINETISSPLYKKSRVENNCNELTLYFKEDFELIFRAYDDGVAYRFQTDMKKDFIVEKENASFNFGNDIKAYVPYVRKENATIEEQFFNSFENTYTYTNISQWERGRLSMTPLLAEVGNLKICITESDLKAYPGMYLMSNPAMPGQLQAMFATYPKEERPGGHINTQLLVDKRETYIAKSKGVKKFPWRVIVVATSDKELLSSDFVYRIASPSQISDYSWVKPGKVAWEWWNDWGIYNVDFEVGVNNNTYKYYIDFASKYGIEYVILDEGWAVSGKADLFDVVPEIDIKELTDYARQKNVGIILWAGYYAFDRDIENVCKVYSDLGVKGFKIDFMDRDDQKMVEFYYRAAKVAAKYKLLVDFHGSYKPTGLNRTYPNVINFEGVHGLEQLKFTNNTIVDQVTYDVTMPFIRQVAGPIDYTQGAMKNSTKSTFKYSYSEPMSQGTRCRQLAQYIIFESPLSMLCDSPTNYMKEEECTHFIANIPTVWDETVPLESQIGKYISIARRKGDEWYVGGMTNWDTRTMAFNLSFLEGDNWIAEVFTDGANANRIGCDYKRIIVDIPQNKRISFPMASGGGCAMKIYQKK